MTEKNRRQAKTANLLETRNNILEIFDAVATSGILRAGVTEQDIQDKFTLLAEQMFGVAEYWHKKIVRIGKNTLCSYPDKSHADVVLTDDDMVFLDFGPVIGKWEGDIGRTYVIGNDPRKHQLNQDLRIIFNHCKQYYHTNPTVSAGDLYREINHKAITMGWEIAAGYLGHLLGEYPHENIVDDRILSYIHPDNPTPLNSVEFNGVPADWILEIQIKHPTENWGGFFEDLLTIELETDHESPYA